MKVLKDNNDLVRNVMVAVFVPAGMRCILTGENSSGVISESSKEVEDGMWVRFSWL